MICRDLIALRVNELRAGGTEAARIEKDGGKQREAGRRPVLWKPGLRVFPW